MTYDVTASIVTFHLNNAGLSGYMGNVRNAINSFLSTNASVCLYIVDNSPEDHLKVLATDSRIRYIHTGQNLGFGRGHNVILEEVTKQSKYHIILNPDVLFERGTVEKICEFMERSPDVGLTIPKVIDEHGVLQNSYKRLPAPFDLMLRRFGSVFSSVFKKRLERYEMLDKDLSKSFDVPSVSGCFMFFRNSALRDIGFFDDRYFIYLEDVDISRRMMARYRNVYFPDAVIVHLHARASYKFNKLLFVHIQSAIKYFNKWGWLFDSQRTTMNQRS
jgi:GT2 family glycosyltransferase